MSPHNAHEPMDPGDLERKQSVFLCHSGAQKGFVEQLDKDLRSVDRYAFFDKDRESLPIGDNFPTLIFQAIERCQVGVVFLSEEFFMRSHWPMFEVVKMVECGRRVMPIFLGISPEDLSNAEKVAEWKSRWEVWAESNGRIDVARWDSTLISLRRLNGLVYNDAIGEVKFREEIVKEVCKIVPPFHVWDDSHVQGRSRISKLIEDKISVTQVSRKGVQVVGLYGVGGIGKTTACKSLCKDFLSEFDGRVCHIEFGDDTSEVERVREVLRRLTNTNNEFVKDRKLDECWSLVKNILRLSKVVLAIDNVWDSSKIHEEVQKYLRLEYGQGSVVMVTARALGELEKLGIMTSNCLAMPELLEEEARSLFVYYAEPRSGVYAGVVMKYVNRCCFGKGDGKGSKHYLPLALRVLGSQMVGKSPLEWRSQLKEEDVYNQLREEVHPVFSILRRSFDSLGNELKMLFMDVALFDLSFNWFSMVHGISVDEVKKRLNVLKKRALLEEVVDGREHLGMHDLWREFAVMETKRGEEDELQWVYEERVSCGKRRTKSCMSGGGWKKLRRIFIEGRRLGPTNFSKCSKVTVLRLINVYVENGALDLSHLKSMRSLELVEANLSLRKLFNEDDGYDLESSDDKDLGLLKVSGIGQLWDLSSLIWWNINDRSLSAVKEVSCLTKLQILNLMWGDASNLKSPLSLDLQELRYLQDVVVQIPGMVSISGFSSRMKGLRRVYLRGCRELKSCADVGDVDGLEILVLQGCRKLEQVPNLRKLVMLRLLNIDGCELVKASPGLGGLVALEQLYGGHVYLDMQELSSMRNLAKLEVLDLRNCYALHCIPGLGNLVALRDLRVYCGLVHGLPDLRNLTRLQKVEIYGWNSDAGKAGNRVSGFVLNLVILESVARVKIVGVDHEVSNVSKLTALKGLELEGCNFERLPHMGSDLILESLRIADCRRLRGWDGVRGLGTGPDYQMDTSSDWTLPYLREIEVSKCESLELPDLRHFPQLRRLSACQWGSCDSRSAVYCHAIHVHLETLKIHYSEIKELPDLGNFPSLRSVDIYLCDSLTNLAISGPLLALNELMLSLCENLRPVPNTSLFPRLTQFLFFACGVKLTKHERKKLIARGFREDRYGAPVYSRTESSSEVVLSPAIELNWHSDEQAAVVAGKDLAAGPSRLEPSTTSDFIPYKESLSEFAEMSVSKRALQLGSSSGSDQEQTKKLKNIESCSG